MLPRKSYNKNNRKRTRRIIRGGVGKGSVVSKKKKPKQMKPKQMKPKQMKPKQIKKKPRKGQTQRLFYRRQRPQVLALENRPRSSSYMESLSSSSSFHHELGKQPKIAREMKVHKNVDGRDVMDWRKEQRGDIIVSTDMNPTRTGDIRSASMIYDSLRP